MDIPVRLCRRCARPGPAAAASALPRQRQAVAERQKRQIDALVAVQPCVEGRNTAGSGCPRNELASKQPYRAWSSPAVRRAILAP
jgi:hypothetical protein